MNPVLLLIFKRPDTTAEVLKAIRQAKPRVLYIAADGPRSTVVGEDAACRQAREAALAVDWDCDVQTLFRDENLGCRRSVSGALDWFFSHEEQGIILEDDCVPHPSFFAYCTDLLDRFRDDDRVMAISGNNFQPESDQLTESYYFSRYMHCWGWATWRRAWQRYDAEMTFWPEFRDRRELLQWSGGDPGFQEYWKSVFEACAAGQIDSWAYRFLLSCWENSGLTVLPAVNLVSNIGFGSAATHTNDEINAQANLPVREIGFPLSHPHRVARDIMRDAFEHKVHFCPDAYRTGAQKMRSWVRLLPGRIVRRGTALFGFGN
ncbi:MAG: hypothetical protein J0G28_11165 [Afipia sp.]|nr:hypothetical protein [Afipia sp.]OJW64417.1 MAG: hypothetical protein BGO65_15875 [Afipia sp. 64-13]